MKTKMISMTVVALLGLAGASSAFADSYNSYERARQAQAKSNTRSVNMERSRSATSNARSVNKQLGLSGYESASTGIGQDHEGYGKIAGAAGPSVSASQQNSITDAHKGYAGPDSAATGIGKDLGSYGKTTGVAGAGATGPGGR